MKVLVCYVSFWGDIQKPANIVLTTEKYPLSENEIIEAEKRIAAKETVFKAVVTNVIQLREEEKEDIESELEELKRKYNKILDAVDRVNTFTIIPDPDLLKQLKETHEKTAQILLENGR